MATTQKPTLSVKQSFAPILLLAYIVAALLVPSGANAAVSPFLTQFGTQGDAAGQLGISNGVATSPTNGHVYVGDSELNRVNEFTAWGNFVKAWGWGVRDGAAELQTCGPEADSPSPCQSGIAGSGVGQLSGPAGVTVDSNGDIYVFESVSTPSGRVESIRVQKFDPSGNFLLMLGGEVDQGPNHPGNVCTAAYIAGGDTCGIGTPGTSNGQFNLDQTLTYISAGPDDKIYVGDEDRIQEFGTDGVYKSQIPLPENSGSSSSNSDPGALAVDPISGDVYFAYSQPFDTRTLSKVFRLDPISGAILGSFEVIDPLALATDAQGNVYVVSGTGFGGEAKVFEYNSAASEIASCCLPDLLAGNAGQNGERFELRAIATNTAGDLYVVNAAALEDTYIRAYGPPPLQFGPPPSAAPSITTEYAVSVDTSEAVVRAQINPHFWEDATYYVQFGTEDCATGGCLEQPVPPGTKLGAGPVGSPATTAGVFLSGLEPGTTYHYRFVAQSQGGGPTFGPDRTFVTAAAPQSPDTDCVNQSFRVGASATLPDCRAYEMVSPLDKSNGDVYARVNLFGYPNALDQSSVDGGRVTYSSYRSFDGPNSSPATSQYLATRNPVSGWSNENMDPPRKGSNLLGNIGTLNTLFKGFSEDLSSTWLVQDVDPPLSPDAPIGFPDLYRRHNADGTYDALSQVDPPNRTPFEFEPELQGFSADGSQAVFRVPEQLTPDAPNLEATKFQLYESYGDGQLRLVSILPNGQASTASSSAGTSNNINGGQVDTRSQNVTHAVSADGSRIFWTAVSGNQGSGPGRLYVRVNGASTVEISKKEDTEFQIANPDGSRLLFTSGGNLSEATLEDEGTLAVQTKLIAHEVVGHILGASNDASRVYFISEAGLNGAPAGSSGKPNLYYYDAGTVHFIATLGIEETHSSSLYSPDSIVPVARTARVSQSGQQLVFTSEEELTGYDNTDANTGQADTEVYLYSATADEGAGRLICISCNPSGARPEGRSVRMPANGGKLLISGTVPPFQNQLYQARYLSDDGKRIFFDSYESLVLEDSNGREDAYEWEAAGSGSCTEDSSAFSRANGGCIYLISSGQSPSDSEFIDASPSGRDVFFTTAASLVPQDYGLIDVYDARVEGGFPPPSSPPAACEGEACQGPLAPPSDPTPASSAFDGPGNVVEGRAKKKVHKRKHVKKHKRAKHNRRSAR
jgi:hypothetical protein